MERQEWCGVCKDVIESVSCGRHERTKASAVLYVADCAGPAKWEF